MSERQVAKLLGMGSTRRPGSETTLAPVLRDAVVTRVDPDGAVWVTPYGGDARAPLGPCRGARVQRLVATGTGTAADANATYDLRWLPLPLRCDVLVAVTARGVWIVNHDER